MRRALLLAIIANRTFFSIIIFYFGETFSSHVPCPPPLLCGVEGAGKSKEVPGKQGSRSKMRNISPTACGSIAVKQALVAKMKIALPQLPCEQGVKRMRVRR